MIFFQPSCLLCSSTNMEPNSSCH